MIQKPYNITYNYDTIMLYWKITLEDFIRNKIPKTLKDSFYDMSSLERMYEISTRMNKELPKTSMPLYYYYDTDSYRDNDIIIFYTKDIYISIKYDTNLYYNREEQIKLNTPIIERKINEKINKEIDTIFMQLEKDIKLSLDKLISFNLPYTKPIVLSKILEIFKNSASYTADNFKDPSIKRSILSVLWLK